MSEIIASPAKARASVEMIFAAGESPCLWGQPGIGKSSLMHQIADDMELQIIDLRAVLMDPVDLRGLPHVKEGRAHWATPDFLPRDGKGILFLDELNRAPMLVQNACFQLVLDKRLGEYVLPKDWHIAAACNRETDGGGVIRMASALANRFIHINMEPSLDDWCAWAAGNGIEPVVIAFLRFRPNLLHVFDKNVHSFPTPRSWAFVSNIISKSPNPDIQLMLVSGAVGEGAAVEFESFLRLFQRAPNIDNILLNPETAPVPEDVASLYAVSAALAARSKPDNFGQVVKYLERLNAPEYAVFCVKDASIRDEKLTATAAFTKWAVKYADWM